MGVCMGLEGGVSDFNRELHCDVRVVAESLSQQCKVAGKGGTVVARLPVVISKSQIQININAKLKFDRYITDIRNCNREMQLTGCKLVDTGNARYGKIFLEGYIKERIEYIDAGRNDGSEFSGVLRFITVKIPFECVTRIDYFQLPLLGRNKGFISVYIRHGSHRDDDSNFGYHIITGDNAIHQNDMSCEVDSYEIAATAAMEMLPLENNVFDQVDECLVLSMTVILLQEQIINIS